MAWDQSSGTHPLPWVSLFESPWPVPPLPRLWLQHLALWLGHIPYLIWAMSPTTISATGIWTTWPARTTVNFCSCSMRLCRPRNCFSLLQSLKAVTRTTQMTERRMAAPSIQPASASPSSSAPAWAVAHPAESRRKQVGWGQAGRRGLMGLDLNPSSAK